MEKKHSCRICKRSFPSGRSLGGHMRSHVVLNSAMAAEENSGSRYRLRNNPTKSRWFSDLSEIPRDELRREMEEVDGGGDGLWSRGSCEEEEEAMQSQSASGIAAVLVPMTKQRSRSRRITAISPSSSFSTPARSSPEYDKEGEDGALCLMMLSRGVWHATDSFDKTSKAHSFPSESEFSLDGSEHNCQEFRNPKSSSLSSEGDQKFKKLKASSISNDAGHGDLSSTVIELRKTSSSNQWGKQSSSKRSMLECRICSKSFHSHQAFGGHRTRHSKMKGARHGSQLDDERSAPSNPRGHECSICGKVFASGQALGGHKRSHLVAESNNSTPRVLPYPLLIGIEQKASLLKLIDLNQPAADD